jgi:hypothetical protein
MRNYAPSLEILEIAYEVSPGGTRTFEVYDKEEIEPVSLPIYETESLTEAVRILLQSWTGFYCPYICRMGNEGDA